MSTKEFDKEMEEKDYSADNLADNMPNEQDIPGEDSLQGADKVAGDVSEELKKTKDDYLRLMAEYDNYRKRTLKEKTELIKNGGEKILSGLLPVVDDIQRALENVDKAKDLSAVKEGVDLIYNKFMTFLQQNGVKPLDVIGKEFDDEVADAVATIPAPKEEQKGTVIDCVQTGYTLNDKVIRHAKVVVAN